MLVAMARMGVVAGVTSFLVSYYTENKNRNRSVLHAMGAWEQVAC